MALPATQIAKPVLTKWQVWQATGFQPHSAQVPVALSPARFRVLVAGRRWGKSLLAAEEALPMILTPNTRGWVVSSTYNLTEKVFRQIYRILRNKLKIEMVREQMSGPFLLELPHGSVVEGKSADLPSSLLGEGLDWLIFDECAASKQIIWEQYLSPTLTDKQGWALFISTPRGYNWFHDLWKRGRSEEFPEWESWRSPSWENPYLDPKEIERQRKSLSDAVFRQEFGAEFGIMEGQVYKDFLEDIHVKQDLRPDSMWRRYRTIDFGYENPFVCLWLAVDPEDRIYVYDEYYQRHRTMPQHIKRLFSTKYKRNKDRSAGRIGERMRVVENKYVPYGDKEDTQYEWTICDVAAKSQRNELINAGIPCFGLKQSITEGLEDVRHFLEVRDDGEPGMYISSRCEETQREFNQYQFTKMGDEIPEDKDNDCMDALRYFCHVWRKGGPTQYIPKMGFRSP